MDTEPYALSDHKEAIIADIISAIELISSEAGNPVPGFALRTRLHEVLELPINHATVDGMLWYLYGANVIEFRYCFEENSLGYRRQQVCYCLVD